MLVVTVIVVVFAPQLLTLVARGLAEKEPLVREIAIQQLRIMAPTAWFAGMIGIGFGALNAADVYWLPSVSPLLSSVTIVVAVGGLAFWLGSHVGDPQYALLGGSVLAGAFVVGTVLQWAAQAIAQKQAGLGGFRLRLDLKNSAVKDVLTVMGPALFASGMLQINVYTDMYFTSYLEKPSAAVSALDYANLLVQTPLGILSNMILVPLLPVFSQLSDPAKLGCPEATNSARDLDYGDRHAAPERFDDFPFDFPGASRLSTRRVSNRSLPTSCYRADSLCRGNVCLSQPRCLGKGFLCLRRQRYAV